MSSPNSVYTQTDEQNYTYVSVDKVAKHEVFNCKTEAILSLVL